MRRALLLLALLGPALAGCTSDPGRGVGFLVGDQAPDFAVQAVDGPRFALAEQRGKVVLLDLMGVNCAPCRTQMPHLLAVARSHADDTAFRMVSVDMASVYPSLGARGEDEIRAFKAEFNATWPFAPDAEGQLGRAYSPITLPTLLVIGPDGVIRFRHGATTVEAEELERRIAAAAEAGAA